MHIHIRMLLATLAFLVAAPTAVGQGVPTATDLRRVTDAVMAKVGAGNIEAGLKAVKPITVIPEAEFEAMLGQAKLQLPLMASRFGASMGQEFIREDRLGESFIRYTYVHKFEKHAMRWVFYCYKGKNGWVINTFRFDDRWHELFQ